MKKIWLKRLQKSVLIFAVALLLVFSYEVNRPKAVAPLIGWGAGMLAGFIIEEAAHMGLKWSTKAIGKRKADEWAAEMWAKQDAEPFDFLKANPYLNKDGSVYISPTAKDRMRIASFIAGAAGGLAAESMLSNSGDGQTAVFSESGFTINLSPFPDMAANDFAWLYNVYEVRFVLPPESGSSSSALFNIYSRITGDKVLTQDDFIEPNSPRDLNMHQYIAADGLPNGFAEFRRYNDAYYGGYISYQKPGIENDPHYWAYRQYKSAADYGATINFADGLAIPSTVNNVYNYTYDDAYNDVYLSNFPELEGHKYDLGAIMPIPEVEGEITWADLENAFVDDAEIESLLSAKADDLLSLGEMTTTTYDNDTINNYYVGATATEPPATTDPTTDPTTTDGTITDVAPINRGMLQIMTESYGYFTDSIDNALTSLETVTSSATGIITFLDDSMRWLPAEWRGLFGAAFALGVFAHFFRR